MVSAGGLQVEKVLGTIRSGEWKCTVAHVTMRLPALLVSYDDDDDESWWFLFRKHAPLN